MIYLLQCPRCHTKFDYRPPTIQYLEPSEEIDDSAPARCPNGHVSIYRLTESQIKNE